MKNIYFYMPPSKKASGGMYVIADLAAHLSQNGKKVFLTSQNCLPDELARPEGAPFLKLSEIDIHPGDYWIVPEGWPNALAPGLKNRATNIVYVQNWAYLLGNLPEGTSWADLPVKFWAVSDPVAHFIKTTTGKDAPVIRPAIDPDLFYPSIQDPKKPLAAGEKPVIAWMPRKNPALARQIRNILEARLRLSGLPSPKWLEISGRSHEDVARLMRQAHIFLATGFPEGCPLPPLEAMASGLVVTGFAGYGGWDYMRPGLPCIYKNSDKNGLLDAQNGFFAADADTFSAALALEKAISLLVAGGEELQKLREAAIRTSREYSPEKQKEKILELVS